MTKQTPLSAFLSDTMTARTVTTEELATALGYKKAFDAECWVQGRSVPPLRMLEPISRALKCSPAMLVATWIATQEPKLTWALDEETAQRIIAARRSAVVRKALSDPGRSMTVDPIDEGLGDPGDDP